LGACAAQDLRHPCRNEIAGSGACARNDRAAVCDRSRHQGQTTGRAPRRASHKCDADPLRVARLPRRDDGKDQGQEQSRRRLLYAASRWTALTRYVGDGRLEMSNNAAERAMRPLALGRTNYLFAGSDECGRRAAIIYTVIETARLSAGRRHVLIERCDRRTGPAGR
jgi:hypothetical protein